MTNLDKRQEECVRGLLAGEHDLDCDDCPGEFMCGREGHGLCNDEEALKEWLRKKKLQDEGKLTFGDLAVGECFMIVGQGQLAVCKKEVDEKYSFFGGNGDNFLCFSGPYTLVTRKTAAHFLEWMEGESNA